MNNNKAKIALLLSMAMVPALSATASTAQDSKPQGSAPTVCAKPGGGNCVWVNGVCVAEILKIVCNSQEKAKSAR